MMAPTQRKPFPFEITDIVEPKLAQQIQTEIDQRNAHYAQILDDHELELWPDFFIAQGQYQIQARENADRNLPLCLLSLESQGMMKDRVYGVTQTIYHAPYYMRHIIGTARIVGCVPLDVLPELPQEALPDQTAWVSQSSFAVFRTKPGSISEVFVVGQYKDIWVSTAEGLKLAWRKCIYDSEMILNSLIYPI